VGEPLFVLIGRHVLLPGNDSAVEESHLFESLRSLDSREKPGGALVAITKTVDDQVEGELESIQGCAGRQLSCVALGVGEGVGQRSESAQ
jgi:hypothetical protein